MDRSIVRWWIGLVVVVALAVGVTTHAVMAADMALGMAMSSDMPADCGDCGDGDAGRAAALCHLVCGNASSLGVDSPLPLQATATWRHGETVDIVAGRSIRPDPSPPRTSFLS